MHFYHSLDYIIKNIKYLLTSFIIPRLNFLFYGTLGLIGGISLQFFTTSLMWTTIISMLFFFCGLIYQFYKRYVQPLFFILAFFCILGGALCFFQLQNQKKFQGLVGDSTVNLKGSISCIEKIQNPRFSYRILYEAQEIEKDNRVHLCKNTIALYIKDKPSFLVGDSIAINNVIFKKNNKDSFTTYLAKEKISASLFLEQLDYTIIERPQFSLNRTIFYFKESLFSNLRTKINRETFQLFSSIFLGNRTAVKKQMDSTKEPFKIWGTSHYLARSGLHLVIFVIIWHFLLGLLPFSFLFKQLFLIILILAYALLSWSSVSFERALLMVLIYKLCLLTRYQTNYVHLIVLVTSMVLLVNPLQLFFLDFQLSFGLTFALAWFNYIEARKKQVTT